jgi:hypothetical protein
VVRDVVLGNSHRFEVFELEVDSVQLHRKHARVNGGSKYERLKVLASASLKVPVGVRVSGGSNYVWLRVVGSASTATDG